MGESRVFIFGKRREDAPKDEPQMTREQMEECIKETEKYTKCPYYHGVCGLDESYVCYCSSTYLGCKVYKELKEED